jgi:putative FmdB family regulatory protein
MPLYDYNCLDCRKKFDLFMSYSEYGVRPVSCPHCHSSLVRRRVNRIRVARSEESRLDSLADPSTLAGMEDDPRALGRMMREMGKEAGEELGPEFDEVVNRLESGQDPGSIEQDLPGLGAGDAEDF